MKGSLLASLYAILCWSTVSALEVKSQTSCDGGRCNFRNDLSTASIQPGKP